MNDIIENLINKCKQGLLKSEPKRITGGLLNRMYKVETTLYIATAVPQPKNTSSSVPTNSDINFLTITKSSLMLLYHYLKLFV